MSDLRVTNLKGRNPGEAPTLPDGVVIAGITTVSSVIVGTGITLSSSGINVSGVITATSFSGNGSGLIGVGLGTTGSINTSGIITATTLTIGAGTTALPSISPTGDSNTGIFFPSADTIAFSEGGTEAMRITNDGYALFNTTNKALRDSTSDVGLSIDPGGGGLLQLAAGGPTFFNRVSSDGQIIAFRRNGANVGSISVTGSATAYNTSSDYRLKENVTVVTDGIARLQQLNPSRFNFIADPDTTVDGFIAHEVQAVVPEAIYGEKDAVDADGNPVYQGIDQSKLVPLLTAALQEAMERIEQLESAVATLQGS